VGYSFDWGWDFDWSQFTSGNLASLVFMLLLNTGAVYRLSRLVSRDTLLGPTRDKVQDRFEGMLVNLMLCMWCLSFWFAIVATFFTAWDTTHDTWLIIAAVLTMSAVVGMLGEKT
jgi:hypothetical protein